MPVSGYPGFPDDVEQVFGDLAQQHAYRTTRREIDLVEWIRSVPPARLLFAISGDRTSLLLESEEELFDVVDLAALEAPETTRIWAEELASAGRNLQRDAYHHMELTRLRKLVDRHFAETIETGIVRGRDVYRAWRAAEDDSQAQYSRAWHAVHALPYEHPVRKMYIADNPAWLAAMLDLLAMGP